MHQQLLSSAPRPGLKASGAGRATRARLFLLASPAALLSPFSAVAHASSAQGINENSGGGGRAPAGKKTYVERSCGADPAGALWRGVSLGVQFSVTSLEKGSNSGLVKRAQWEHPCA